MKDAIEKANAANEALSASAEEVKQSIKQVSEETSSVCLFYRR